MTDTGAERDLGLLSRMEVSPSGVHHWLQQNGWTPVVRWPISAASCLSEQLPAASRSVLVPSRIYPKAMGLAAMGSEGRLPYQDLNQVQSPHQDSHHSGFEIRALHGLWRLTGREAYTRAFRRYFDFSMAHFSGADGAPWRNSDDDRLVDVHGCAEALLLYRQIAQDEAQALEYLRPSHGGSPTYNAGALSDGCAAIGRSRRHSRLRTTEHEQVRRHRMPT